MASALASPPPLFSGGSADIKTNARRFLERALLISVLVHLAAVGVFRAVEERSRARWDRDNPAVPSWEHTVDIGPTIMPIDWNRQLKPPVRSDKGAFEPTESKITIPGFDPGAAGRDFRGIPAGPGASEEWGTSHDPSPPPSEPARPFVPAADTPPVPIVAPRPAYPQWAREAGIEGKVLVRVLVGTDGIPKNAVIVSGPKGLIEGVVDAVLRWKFKPGLANKEPVEVWVEIPISFRLGE